MPIQPAYQLTDPTLGNPAVPPVNNMQLGQPQFQPPPDMSAPQVAAPPLQLPPQPPPNAAASPDVAAALAAPPSVAPLNPLAGDDYLARSAQQHGELDQQKSAIDADRQAQQADKEAAAVADQQAQIAQQAADHQAMQSHMAEIEKQREAAITKLMSTHIDPNRLWNKMDTGERVMSNIGILVSGLGQGLSAAGGHQMPNMAMDRLNKAIDDDIGAQKTDMDNGYKGAVALGQVEDSEQARAKYHDDWMINHQLNSWTVVERQLKNIENQTASPITKIGAQQAALTVQDKIAGLQVDKFNKLAAAQAAAAAQQKATIKEAEGMVSALGVQWDHDHEGEKDATSADRAKFIRDNLPPRLAAYKQLLPVGDNKPFFGEKVRQPEPGGPTPLQIKGTELLGLVDQLEDDKPVPEDVRKEIVSKGGVPPTLETHWFSPNETMTPERKQLMKTEIASRYSLPAPPPLPPKEDTFKEPPKAPASPAKEIKAPDYDPDFHPNKGQ